MSPRAPQSSAAGNPRRAKLLLHVGVKPLPIDAETRRVSCAGAEREIFAHRQSRHAGKSKRIVRNGGDAFVPRFGDRPSRRVFAPQQLRSRLRPLQAENEIAEFPLAIT